MKTTQECWQALIDGEKLKHNSHTDKGFAALVGGFLVNHYGQQTSFQFNYPEEWSIYTPQKWFSNIPEHGVLCWWGNDRSTAVTITSIDEDGWFVDRAGEAYPDVTPLTKQEIQTLLDNAPEDKE